MRWFLCVLLLVAADGLADSAAERFAHLQVLERGGGQLWDALAGYAALAANEKTDEQVKRQLPERLRACMESLGMQEKEIQRKLNGLRHHGESPQVARQLVRDWWLYWEEGERGGRLVTLRHPQPSVGARLESMVLSVDLRNATVADAIAYLRRRSLEVDPDERGIPVTLVGDDQTLVDRRVNLSLNQVRLYDAYKLLVEQADLAWRFDRRGIVLGLPGSFNPHVTRIYPVESRAWNLDDTALHKRLAKLGIELTGGARATVTGGKLIMVHDVDTLARLEKILAVDDKLEDNVNLTVTLFEAELGALAPPQLTQRTLMAIVPEGRRLLSRISLRTAIGSAGKTQVKTAVGDQELNASVSLTRIDPYGIDEFYPGSGIMVALTWQLRADGEVEHRVECELNLRDGESQVILLRQADGERSTRLLLLEADVIRPDGTPVLGPAVRPRGADW